ncbi:MAG: ABC transporter substrate-binding protein [Hyphomicrobiaceae bacterium]
MRLVQWVRLIATAALAVLAPAGATTAQELKVGLSAEPSAMDPHFHNLTPNNSVLNHVFERLIEMDEKQRLIPGLAESWKVIDGTIWEFKLRKGVTWHDGSPFTADDVVFTMTRAGNVPNSPSSFGSAVKGKTATKVDDLTVRIATPTVYPTMGNDLATIMIVSKKHGEGATTEDYNSGKAAIGTGPFKLAKFTPGDRIEMVRNDAYWGPKPKWNKVMFRAIKVGPARVAALLAGDVDFIEDVPTSDIERLKKEPKLDISQGVSNRLIYFFVDHARDTTPFAKGKDGAEIKNPFKDKRVRLAVSKAINRDAIVQRVMEGVAIPASQFLPEGYFGVSDKLKPEKFDADGAKKLLAEAGLANGFKLSLHSPNGRYTNDSKIAEAVAQMLTRIGIETSLELLPPAVFFQRASSGGPQGGPEFSFILVGWSAGTGEASGSLKPLVATFDKDKGMGATNRGRYSNPEVDRLIEEALKTVDDPKRAALLAQATDLAIADVAVIPLHYQVNTWAARKGLKYTARSDEYTLVTFLKGD